MTMVNAYTGADTGMSAADRDLVARRERVLGPAYKLFYRHPTHIVRGEGVWLFDVDGRRYLDAYNNVASLGHCHPHVVTAIARQAAVLNTHTRYLHDGIVDYAERLLATMPPEIAHVMLTCTGSEANDLALRIARAATGNEGVIVTALAYHGVTASVAEASPSFGPGNRLGDAVWTVAAPPTTGSADEVANAFAAGVDDALVDMARRGVMPAALLVDTVFSSDGIVTDPAGFLAPAVARMRAAGGLFIADEVQAGFGRTGEAMWGFARHGVAPDLVTMGKPMGNGHPVAGVAGRAEPIERFGRAVRYFNTVGGNPVSCAAAMAVLDVIERDGLMQNALTIGASLRRDILALAGRFPSIAAVRGAGLFLGVELGDAGAPSARALTDSVVNGMRERGVLISATGPGGNVLKIRPPLVLDAPQAALIVECLAQTLEAARDM